MIFLYDNFFTVKHSLYEDSYRYHPLFREFLLTRSSDLFEPEEINEIRRNSAELLAESGMAEDAVLLCRQAGDLGGLVRLILQHAPSLMAQGRIKTLLEWIESLPEKNIESVPWLLYWRGMCLLILDPAGSHDIFKRAFRSFQATGDTAGVFLAWAGAVNAIALSYQNIDSLSSWFSMIDDLVARHRFPSEPVEMQVLSAIFLAATNEGGHDLDKWVEKAMVLALGGHSRDVVTRTQLLSGLTSYLLICRGDTARASVAVKLLREISQFREATPLALIMTRLAEATYYEFTALHEPCLMAVSEGLKTAGASGVHIMDYMLLGQVAFSSLNTGDMAAAGKFISDMTSSLKSTNRLHTAFYHYLSTCEALRRKDMQQALVHIDVSMKLLSDREACQGSALNYIVKALIMHELGRPEEARQDLARAAHIGSTIKTPYIEFSCKLTEAYFSFSQGNETAGLAALRQAMTLGRGQGLYITFLWRPSALTSLCAKALEERIEVEYVQELIKRCHLSPDDDQLFSIHSGIGSRDHAGRSWRPGRIRTERWPYFLKIHTLGRFEMVEDGKPLSFSGKVQHKPLAMLKALIAFGGTEVDVEKISDALWPEADGDLARLSFKFSLHQLRKLIGGENIVHMSEGKVSLDSRNCWVDIWAFGHLFEEMENIFRQNKVLPETAFTDLAGKAMDLYRGDFLSEESRRPWINPTRERLKSRFIRIVDLAGNYHEEAGQWEKAIHYYRKALEVDDLQEEFYRGIMRCCHQLGRRGEAMAVYRCCRMVLSETFGIDPAPETDALYRKICGENLLPL